MTGRTSPPWGEQTISFFQKVLLASWVPSRAISPPQGNSSPRTKLQLQIFLPTLREIGDFRSTTHAIQYVLSTTDESHSATLPRLQTGRRENTAVCPQLDQAHPRCLGSRCHQWLPSTSIQMATESLCQLFPNTVSGLCHTGRSGETNRKRSSCNGAKGTDVDLQPLLHGAQKRRRVQTNTGPEIPKHTSRSSTLQNGGVTYAPHNYTAKLGIGKVDLKDAYLTIPVTQEFHQLLAFQVKPGKWAQFKCLPFGLYTAPFIFTKVTKPVTQFLCQQGIHIILYLDDLL